jgi:hypothetical protein
MPYDPIGIDVTSGEADFRKTELALLSLAIETEIP